jgi:DNA-binding transcriptional ArsR family regulator
METHEMTTNSENRDSLRAYLEANRRVQAAQTDATQYIPVTILNSFLGVALWGGYSNREEPTPLEVIAERLGITPQTLSTHLRYLGDRYREGKEGMGLVELDTYVLNRRMKVARLTAKGKALADQLMYILRGTQNDNPPQGQGI